ncbi:hypothetical protein C8Q70DRAFT_1106995 [Cubamyces menziesii]|nr:hypothetical protein C8Q70DRAFT_1106995 [Cubamyces menziesii]
MSESRPTSPSTQQVSSVGSMQSNPSTATSSLIPTHDHRGTTGLGGAVWAGTTQQDPGLALPSTPSHGAFMTNGNPGAPHAIPHGMQMDPTILLSVLTTLAAGQSNMAAAVPPVADNNHAASWSSTPHRQASTGFGANVGRHIVPPEALPPSPMLPMGQPPVPVNHTVAARTQAYPTVPWDYSGNGGDGQPIAVDPLLLRPEQGAAVPALATPASDGVRELFGLSPAGKEALLDLIDERVEVAFKKRGCDSDTMTATTSKKMRGIVPDAREVPMAVRHAVWTNTHFLLGTGADVTITQTGKPSHFKLPTPLKPDQPIRFAPDGTRLYNPIWSLPIDKGINDLFVSAVVKLTMSNGGDPPFNLPAAEAQDEALITLAAKAYMKSLKRSYTLLGPGGATKKAKKQVADKFHGRRARKYDYLVKAIPAFRKVFGHAKTVGIEEIVQVGWMSDEHSAGEGVEDPARKEQRENAGVGQSAWELRSPLWRSRKLYIIYFVLAVIRRFMRDCKVTFNSKDPATTVPEGSDDESDLSDGARKMFLDRMATAVRTWRSVLIYKGRYERFRGSDDTRARFPRDGVQDGIYKECLSRTWASAEPQNQAYYDHARPCPDNFAIFQLDIPLSLLPEDDRGWLADCEDEGTEEVE